MKPKLLHNERYYITIVCSCLLVLSVVLYMYFLSLSVVHVVMQKEVLREAQSIQSEIAQLESAYIEAHHQVSQKVAIIDEYSAVKEKTFIVRAAGQGLVLRSDE